MRCAGKVDLRSQGRPGTLNCMTDPDDVTGAAEALRRVSATRVGNQRR